MSETLTESYLVNKVLTATPEKLQLILIEAAISAAERAKHHWQAKDDEKACEALVRAQEIVGELLAGLNHNVDPPLVRRVAGIYAFVLQRLVEASLQRDPKGIDDAVRVLRIERDTWQQVCQKMAAQRHAAQCHAGQQHAAGGEPISVGENPGAPGRQPTPPAPHRGAIPPVDAPAAEHIEGLSLEA